MTNYKFIYELNGGRYAAGMAGTKATEAVRLDAKGRHEWYLRITKPVIPADAVKLTRRQAGPDLCKALGVTYPDVG